MGKQDRAQLGTSDRRIQMALRRVAATGFEPGGDLSGDATSQVVTAMQGIPTPSADSAQPGEYLRTEALLTTPRSVVVDGDELWVGESGQTVAGSPFVWCFDMSEPLVPGLVAKVDLSAELPSVDRVRDLAQDNSYVFAATWDARHVAIINKPSHRIVGWAATSPDMPVRVLSCATDGAGKLFALAIVDFGGANTPVVLRWSLSACLQTPPDTAMPEASVTLPNWARHVRYGMGSLYVFDANFGTGIFRINPVSMAIETSLVLAGSFMDGLVAFGSVWAVNLYGPLLRLDPTTLAVQAAIALPGAGTPGPVGIDRGTNGDGSGQLNSVWVSDMGVGVAWRISPSNNAVISYPLPTYSEGVAGNGNRTFLGAYAGNIAGADPGIIVVDPSAPSATLVKPLALVYEALPPSNTTIVWRPSGPVNAPNVFQTWPEVVDACQQIQGLKTIFVDSPLAVVPPGDWDPGGYTILKGRSPTLNGAVVTAVEFQDARIRNIFEFEDVRMYASGTSVSPLVQSFQSGGRLILYYFRGFSSIEVHPNGLPFMVIDPPAPPGRDVHVFLQDCSYVRTAGGGGPALFVTTVAACGLLLHMQDGAVFGQGCYRDTGGATASAIIHSSSALVEYPQLTAIPESLVSGRNMLSGNQPPNNFVYGRIGDLYTDTNGGAATLWVKQSSPTPTTGWVAK